MSGLARMLVARECLCTGSDQASSPVTEALIADGIDVHAGPARDRLPEGTELVVASAAIAEDHPEIVAARSLGLPVLSYPEALGQLQRHRLSIAISGTHGKSTTASMLCHILVECGLDPGFIIGANCSQIGGGSRTGAETVPHGPHEGEPGILVCEACEFNRSFHHHRPDLALINNLEEDHLDIYGSLEAIIEAFREFAGADTTGRGRRVPAHRPRRCTASVDHTQPQLPRLDVRLPSRSRLPGRLRCQGPAHRHSSRRHVGHAVDEPDARWTQRAQCRAP